MSYHRSSVPRTPSSRTRSLKHTDRTPLILIAVTLLLTAVGLIAVGTAASEYSAAHHGGDPMFLFKQQALRALIGIAIMLAISRVPYEWWRPFAIPALAGAAVLLALVVFRSPLAVEANGAWRWLQFGSFRFQPSELARYALVLFIAWWAWRKGRELKTWKGILPALAVVVGFSLLVGIEDYSVAAALLATAMLLLFVAGMNWLHVVVLTVPVALLGAIGILSDPNRMTRIAALMDPWSDPTGSGYQPIQSFTGMGRGGLIGVGPGQSQQKMFFLPEAHTDFIYAIIGEEFGFIGTVIVLGLFIVLIYTGLRVARRSPDPFAAYLAAGITLTIGLYALANMAIAVGVLPPTGLPLPLISYGGTSLLVTLASLGILLNIARHAGKKPAPVIVSNPSRSRVTPGRAR